MLPGAEVLCEVIRFALTIVIAGMKKAFSLIADEMIAFQQKFQALLPLDTFEICLELGLCSMIVVACLHPQPRGLALVTAIHASMATMAITTATEALAVAESIIWVEPLMGCEAESLILDIEHHSIVMTT
jgi:hypothetical protein